MLPIEDNVEKFLSDLTNPYFWLAVVFVGIVINLLSAALIKASDALVGRVPSWLRSRRDSQKTEFERTVSLMVRFPQLIPIYAARESRFRHMANLMFIVAILPFLVRDTLDASPAWLSTSIWLGCAVALPSAALCLTRASVAMFTLHEAASRFQSKQ